MIMACWVTMASSMARPLSVAVSSTPLACASASLNGVTYSTSRACVSVDFCVSSAITTEMPTELPMLRTSVRIALPSVRRCPGRVANATVLSGTNTKPTPNPWITPTTTMVDAAGVIGEIGHLVERVGGEQPCRAITSVRASTSFISRPTAIIAISVPTPRAARDCRRSGSDSP